METDAGERQFTVDQKTVEALIAASLAEAASPIPPEQFRDAIRDAADRQQLCGCLTDLCTSTDSNGFRDLLVRSLFTADVLGYLAAQKRVGVDLGLIRRGIAAVPRTDNPQAVQCIIGLHRPRSAAEGIAWAHTHGVRLPEEYYGEFSALARAMALTIDGLARLDQFQDVVNALDEAMEHGESFSEWQARTTEPPGNRCLDLAPRRLKSIFRNYIQGHYAHGRCVQHQSHLRPRPYLVYEATNDGPPRTGHVAMHGFVAAYDNPAWTLWRPPCGDGCRCRVISLSEQRAAPLIAVDEARLQRDPAAADARARALHCGPDAGWDYDPCATPREGLRRAIQRRLDVHQGDLAEESPSSAEQDSRGNQARG